MTDHARADQARKGLIDSVKGKAKEVVGAVIGNDSLTTEGQLEQTQAQERKAANGVEAVADAEAEQARSESSEAKLASVMDRNAVDAHAAAAKGSVQAQQDAHVQAAEQAGARDAIRSATQAEIDASEEIRRAKAEEARAVNAAADDFADAAADHETAEHIATNAHEEADRIRARAEALTNDAGLN
jgi:uncharacterized protein YjbJ (UPF0337 family)